MVKMGSCILIGEREGSHFDSGKRLLQEALIAIFIQKFLTANTRMKADANIVRDHRFEYVIVKIRAQNYESMS